MIARHILETLLHEAVKVSRTEDLRERPLVDAVRETLERKEAAGESLTPVERETLNYLLPPMSEHNKEVTADKIGYFPNEQGDYTVTYNDEPFCVARFEKEAKWIVREFRSIIEREREDALQSSPAQEVEKPDFVAMAIETSGKGCSVGDHRNCSCSEIQMGYEQIWNDYVSPLLKENQSLKDVIVKKSDAISALGARIKSLEAEKQELRDELKFQATHAENDIAKLKAENKELRKVDADALDALLMEYRSMRRRKCTHYSITLSLSDYFVVSRRQPLPSKPEN